MRIKDAWRFVIDIRNAYSLWKDDKEEFDETWQVFEQLKRYCLLDGILPDHINPALFFGQAIKFAEEYHITLHTGTCYGDCRAELHKDDWLYDIHPSTDVWDYSDFTLQNKENVDRINAWNLEPATAICKCLIRAKKCGVI